MNSLVHILSHLSEQIYRLFFSCGQYIDFNGIEEMFNPEVAGRPYIDFGIFDFVDQILYGFLSVIFVIMNSLSKLYVEVTNRILDPNNHGVPVRDAYHRIGDSEYFTFELLKKMNSSFHSIDPFHRQNIMKTLEKIPGGLDIPESILLVITPDCEALQRFFENRGVIFDPDALEGLGEYVNPLKSPLVWNELGLTIDDDEPASMKVQGINFDDNAILWYDEPTFYKFYKSKLWKWFEQTNSKTLNLNDLGLSYQDKMLVLDNLWPKTSFHPIDQLGYAKSGSYNMEESIGTIGSNYDLERDTSTVVRHTMLYKHIPTVFGSTMKQRSFEALDGPRSTIIPFINHNMWSLIGMFKNFGECRKPIYINNEFYMEGFETKFLAHYDILLLPDSVSRFLQLRFNLVDTDKITYFQYIIAFSIQFYSWFVGVRYLLFWLIGFNPYQNFFSSVIATSVDWIETIFGAYLPSFYGIPLSIPLFLILWTRLQDFTYRLTFTFPYLPSEVSIQYIYGNGLMNIYPRLRETLDRWDLSAMEKFLPKLQQNNKDILFNNECFAFLRFEGLPKLWVENGIPDQIRFSWFWKHPLIFKKYYQDFEVSRIESNIQFLPNIILKDLNSNLHDLNLHDLQKMNTKELYSFLLENLSQNLRTDLVNLLFVESNAKHIDVSDFLDPARLEIYSEILKKVFDIN